MDLREGLPIISYLRCAFVDVTSLILLNGGKKVSGIPLRTVRKERHGSRQNPQSHRLSNLSGLSVSLGHTHIHTPACAQTYSHRSHAVCPLQQAPTSKPSPFSAVTSRVAMVTPAPPQSRAELTCLTAYILHRTAHLRWLRLTRTFLKSLHKKKPKTNKKQTNTWALLPGAPQSVVFKGQSQPPLLLHHLPQQGVNTQTMTRWAIVHHWSDKVCITPHPWATSSLYDQ